MRYLVLARRLLYSAIFIMGSPGHFTQQHVGYAALIQQVMFMKNLSMLSAALLISYFGAGPLSFDARRAKDFDRAAVDRAA